MSSAFKAQLALGAASFIAAAGALMHASVFDRAAGLITGSNLPAVVSGSAKALWLADSATLLIVAALFATLAVRPRAANRGIVLLLALIPASTAVMIYVFLGGFFAGHMLLAIAALAGWAAFQLPPPVHA